MRQKSKTPKFSEHSGGRCKRSAGECASQRYLPGSSHWALLVAYSTDGTTTVAPSVPSKGQAFTSYSSDFSEHVRKSVWENKPPDLSCRPEIWCTKQRMCYSPRDVAGAVVHTGGLVEFIFNFMSG